MMPPRRPSRKQAKAERVLFTQATQDEKKVRLLARLGLGETLPRVGVLPETGLGPRVQEDPRKIFETKMTWCITRKDTDGRWSWGQPRQWTDQEYHQHIKSTLDALMGSTWKDIHQMISGGRQMHHEQDVNSIVQEAQERWAERGIETDMAFRFRLTGRQRAWGFREGSHFRLVWYDKEHRIYPVEKSHT